MVKRLQIIGSSICFCITRALKLCLLVMLYAFKTLNLMAQRAYCSSGLNT